MYAVFVIIVTVSTTDTASTLWRRQPTANFNTHPRHRLQTPGIYQDFGWNRPGGGNRRDEGGIMCLQKGELWKRRRWIWILSHFPCPEAHVLATRASERACVIMFPFWQWNTSFFNAGCSQVRCAQMTRLRGRGCHSRDSPGRQACLPDSTVCLQDDLAIYGGRCRCAIVHLYMCCIKYTQHSLVKSHYHIKATGERLRYFSHHIHVHVQVTWHDSCSNNTKQKLTPLTKIRLLFLFFLSLLLNQNKKNRSNCFCIFYRTPDDGPLGPKHVAY